MDTEQTDEEKIDQIKSKLPAKLKIIAEAWNPVLQLLALAFDNGKIMGKSIERKTCWKRNLCEEDGVIKNIWKISAEKEPYKIHSMAWSPDGSILAVSMNNGFIHMLSASTGRIGYTVNGLEPYKRLIWKRVIPEDPLSDPDPFISFATASSFDFNDESPKECAQTIADMEEHFHQNFHSFQGTVLFGIDEDQILHLYINGVMFCLKLSFADYCEVPMLADIASLSLITCTVDLETKEVQAIYEMTEMESNEILQRTYIIKFDLGWDRETFGTLSVIASSLSKINFLLIYLREMTRYTAHGLEESTEMFYQKVIRCFYGNYKTTTNAPWTFFHEMIQHITGNPVSLAYFDSLRKARGGAAAPMHYSKLIMEYSDKRLGALEIGAQKIALAAETIIRLYTDVIDYYTTDFLLVSSRVTQCDDAHISSKLHSVYSYYIDMIVFLQLIEKLRTEINKKRIGFEHLSYYLTQVNTKNEDTFRGHLTIYLENINIAAFCDFLGEALVHSDLRIPSSILQNVIPNVPRLANPPEILAAIRNIVEMSEPIGCYPLPRYVASCNVNCPHNSEYLYGEKEQIALQINADLVQSFNDINPRKSNPIASVYLWRTERYFDFFTKYFPEYGSAKYPPQEISDLMAAKLDDASEKKAIDASLQLIFGKEKYCYTFDIDRKELMNKMSLRPTVFLALMPLFSFEKNTIDIFSRQYPTCINVSVEKI